MGENRSATDHGVMRELNRSLVLDQLRRHGVASRSAISGTTGLAKPTVSLIVEDLLREGLVVEVGRGATGAVGGRPPVLLSYNARSAHLVAIHLGVGRTTVVVADALGTELGRTTVRTAHARPLTAVRRIGVLVRRTLADAGVRLNAVAAAGVCLPGLVAADDGMLLLAPHLGWRDVPIARLLADELGVSVTVHNTAQTSLLAEATEGAAAGESDVVLVYAGTGVGAAALSSGRLVAGDGGLAGEVGHCPVRPDGERCLCGMTGCLETVASGPAIARAAAALWSASRTVPAPLDAGEGITARDVALAAAAGDRVAIGVLADAAQALGSAAAWLVNVLAPRTVVLGGGLAGAGDAFVAKFRAAVEAGTLPRLASSLRIVASALGQDAEVRGVVILARDRVQAGPRVVRS